MLRLATLTALSACLAAAAVPASADVVVVDFGTDPAAPIENFNTIRKEGSGPVATLENLVTRDGTATAIDITMAGFQSFNANGAPTYTGDPSLFGNAAISFMYGQDGEGSSVGTVVFSELDLDSTYDFLIFGSRTASGNRDTLYQFSGSNSGSGEVNPVNNSTTLVSVSGITPTENGEILLTVTKALGNTNGSGFYYINALQMTSNVVPEPASLALLGLGGLAMLRRSRA